MSMSPLDCPGMREDNPLGFLAAIGLLRAIACTFPDHSPKLSWKSGHAVLHTENPGLPDGWADVLASALKEHAESIIPHRPIIQTDVETFRDDARARLCSAHLSDDGWARLSSDLRAGMATDATPTDIKTDAVTISAWSFANGGSGKNLLKDIRTLAAHCDAASLHRAVRGAFLKSEDEDLPTVRWDPAELREYAYRSNNPGDSKTAAPTTPRQLQLLAMLGLSLLPVFNTEKRTVTTGQNEVHTSNNSNLSFHWPVWESPLSYEEIGMLVGQNFIIGTRSFSARRMIVGKNKNKFFSPATPVARG